MFDQQLLPTHVTCIDRVMQDVPKVEFVPWIALTREVAFAVEVIADRIHGAAGMVS